MADNMDWLRAGQVAQVDPSSSLATGVQLAQAHQAHLLNVEKVKQDRQVLELKKAEWLAGKLRSGAGIVNNQARTMYFKNLADQARQAQIPFDPANVAIFSDEKNAKAIQDIEMNAAGMKPGDASRMYLDMLHAAGDSSQTEATLGHHRELIIAQANAQFMRDKTQREFTMQTGKAFEEAKSAAATQNKENTERLTFANQIIGVAADPSRHNDPYSIASVHSALAKAFFPGGVIRESEIQFLDHINPGMGQQIKAWASGKLGEGKMTDQMLFSIGQLAQHMGAEAQANVQTQKLATQKYLPPGVSAEDVYSTTPKLDNRDILAAFPKLFPDYEPGKSSVARSSDPGIAPQLANATLPVEAHNKLTAYAKKRGLTLEQIKGQGAKAPVAPQGAPSAPPPGQAFGAMDMTPPGTPGVGAAPPAPPENAVAPSAEETE
jgi:hypothetical protein